ncbi:MAG: hypothetical protein FWD27_03060 [Coriobacteriia bacterium]|nr:hypothetical protein [Coriobacteriia bacterium]
MKNITKKLFVLVAALTLGMGLVLAGCGGSEDNGNEIQEPIEIVPGVLNMTYDELEVNWTNFMDSQATWSDITYEKVEAHFGVEGVPQASSSDTVDEFVWYASDTGALYVLFNKEDGSFASSTRSASATP